MAQVIEPQVHWGKVAIRVSTVVNGWVFSTANRVAALLSRVLVMWSFAITQSFCRRKVEERGNDPLVLVGGGRGEGGVCVCVCVCERERAVSYTHLTLPTRR